MTGLTSLIWEGTDFGADFETDGAGGGAALTLEVFGAGAGALEGAEDGLDAFFVPDDPANCAPPSEGTKD